MSTNEPAMVFLLVFFIFFCFSVGAASHLHIAGQLVQFLMASVASTNFRWLVTLWFPKVLAFLKAMATNHGTEETLAATVFVARNVWNPSSDF